MWKPTSDSKFESCPNPLCQWGRGSKSHCTVLGSCQEQRGWAGDGDRHPQLQFSLWSLAGFQASRDIKEKLLNFRIPRQTRRNCVAAGWLSKKPCGIKDSPQPQLRTKAQEMLPCDQYLCSVQNRASLQRTCQHHVLVLPHRHAKAACHKKQQRCFFSGLSQIIPSRASWKKHLFSLFACSTLRVPKARETACISPPG